MEKTFTVVGVAACPKGVYKVRYANNGAAARAAVLKRDGFTDIEFIEVDAPLTKFELVDVLLGHTFTSEKAAQCLHDTAVKMGFVVAPIAVNEVEEDAVVEQATDEVVEAIDEAVSELTEDEFVGEDDAAYIEEDAEQFA